MPGRSHQRTNDKGTKSFNKFDEGGPQKFEVIDGSLPWDQIEGKNKQSGPTTSPSATESKEGK